MEFKRVTDMTNATPTEALCAAWNLNTEDVGARKRQETPLTVREAGSLAELHGLRLEDVLPI